ncbi:single-strand binding protein [Nitritalea halalkaliphila LW7]|uniref:Single-stranded DNA-binding protein n=1 Tax=Nitritalea halalkaliphila LW7 TaxID=1189621 RepID=I5C772_9BACT|nr:single-stranded DNA-binding protein [Nitritalea halalkaliphila]EIM77674.1 single-strand binding protein [Nitritalea halalkaliphila LW7]
MAGVNKVILVGNLGQDPEVRHLEGDKVVANCSLATSESYRDRNGQRMESTEWHDLELWDGLARIAEQYLRKGSKIFVEGKIKTDSWTDQEGNNRKKTKIRVLSMTMLDGRPEGGGMGGGASAPQRSNQQIPPSTPPMQQAGPSNAGPSPDFDGGDDDLPF